MVIAVVVVVCVLSIPRLATFRHSANLYAQAASFVRGNTVPQSALGPLSDHVPIPPGFRLMGVTQPDHQAATGVVGLAAQGSLQGVADGYVEAMKQSGWRLLRVDEGLGVITMQRDGTPSFASVMFRPTSGDSVTVVVQVK